MSKKAAEHHKKASQHSGHASKHHAEAAKHHEAGRHEKAAHHAHTADAHGRQFRMHADGSSKGARRRAWRKGLASRQNTDFSLGAGLSRSGTPALVAAFTGGPESGGCVTLALTGALFLSLGVI
jgi:hypothetical protein